jgi:hypothetical protein
MKQEEKQDKVKEAIDQAQAGIRNMENSSMTAEARVVQLGQYINNIETAQADKMNEMSEDLRKTKLAANLGAIVAGLGVLGGGGVLLYNYMQNRNGAIGASAVANGEVAQ